MWWQTDAESQRRKLKLDIDLLESQLAKLATETLEQDWRKAPLSEIIDFIIVRYHDRHREQLPELILQAQKLNAFI